MTPVSWADRCGRGALTPLGRRWSKEILRSEGTPPTGVIGRTHERSAFVRGLRRTIRGKQRMLNVRFRICHDATFQ